MPRPRRSVLYMPGSNTRAISKARTLPVDVVVLDLEDAVAPGAKEGARRAVVEELALGGFGRREVVVRINSLGSQWGREDLLAIAASPTLPDAILLPKVESAADVSDMWALSQELSCDVWCMIETPRGVLRAAEISEAKGVSCLVAGTSDLAAEMRCDGDADMRQAMLPALSTIVLAGRAAGIAVLDGVTLDLSLGAEQLVALSEQGRRLGFDGKTLIHPKQIEAANEAHTPTSKQTKHSRLVLRAYEESTARGDGVAVLNGQLVEILHVKLARATLALASACEGKE